MHGNIASFILECPKKVTNRLSVKKFFMPIFLVIVLLATGGVSWGAQNSLPGDTLYPIKIEVNERVNSWAAITDESEAKLASKLALRRIEEAEELLSKDEFNVESKEKIEARFETHTAKMEEKIAKLEEKNKLSEAAEINSNFEASLRAHEQILVKLASKSGKSKDDAVSVTMLVDLKTKDSAENQSRIEAKIRVSSGPDAKSAAEGKKKSAENKIKEVKKYIENKKEDLDSETTLEAEAKIKIAENLITEGRADLGAEKFADAFAKFQRASKIAQEAKLLVEAKVELDVDVSVGNISVDIDDDLDEIEEELRDDDDDDDDNNVETEISAKIRNDKADLRVKFEDGDVRLSGKLTRSTPCIEWDVKTITSKDKPPSEVTFDIASKSGAEICVQVLGKPEEVDIRIPASQTANIKVILEGEVIFSGKLQ